MKGLFRVPLVMVIVVTTLLVACTGSPAQAPTAAPTQAPAKPTSAPAAAQPTAATAAQPTAAAAQPAKVYKIGITQLFTHPHIDNFRAAFIEEMTKLGWVQGKNVTYDQQNAQMDMSVAATIAEKFAGDKVDLILSVTTPTTLAAMKAAPNTPVVFGEVTDPVGSGLLKDKQKPGGFVTGVQEQAPQKEGLQFARDIMEASGKKLNKVGTVYNPGETNSRNSLARLKDNTAALQMELVESTASTSAEVQMAIQSLVGKVDGFYAFGDNTAMSAIGTIVKFGQDNKIPVFADNTDTVRNGAIATVGWDEKAMGRQAAGIVDKILRGTKPGDIPVEVPQDILTVVNPGAANKMGIQISDALAAKAAEVVK